MCSASGISVLPAVLYARGAKMRQLCLHLEFGTKWHLGKQYFGRTAAGTCEARVGRHGLIRIDILRSNFGASVQR
jgi:hypothetical protein